MTDTGGTIPPYAPPTDVTLERLLAYAVRAAGGVVEVDRWALLDLDATLTVTADPARPNTLRLEVQP